ncbi:unnamed protein product [Boreogadus saida]
MPVCIIWVLYTHSSFQGVVMCELISDSPPLPEEHSNSSTCRDYRVLAVLITTQRLYWSFTLALLGFIFCGQPCDSLQTPSSPPPPPPPPPHTSDSPPQHKRDHNSS